MATVVLPVLGGGGGGGVAMDLRRMPGGTSSPDTVCKLLANMSSEIIVACAKPNLYNILFISFVFVRFSFFQLLDFV
jgi:hypothetical protein